MRRLLVVLLVIACAVGVVGYQVTRPSKAPADPSIFVPSPKFFADFSPSFRTSIADAYYLEMVQYYGDHVTGDGRLDSLPAMARLVTSVSPRFTRGYLFAAFALIDAGRPDVAYEILQKGFKANPQEWRFPAYAAFFIYTFGEKGTATDRAAAAWYGRAAAVPGSPSYLPRLAARLLTKAGGQTEKAILLWGQAYMAGDKYAREKAVNNISAIMPKGRQARLKALAPLSETMPESAFQALLEDLFPGGKL